MLMMNNKKNDKKDRKKMDINVVDEKEE